MTARAAFRQGDVTRAIRGVEAAGLKVARVECEAGKIIIHTEEPEQDNDDWRKGSPLYEAA